MSEASISVKLGELLELVIDHRGKTPKKMGFEDFHQSGFPVLSAKHVKNGELVNTESFRFANEDMYRKWMKVEVEEGDIILTSEAPLGKVFYLDGSKKYVLGQRLFGLRPRKNLVDPVYLTVWLTSTNGQAALTERATGSTVLGIKQSELLKIEVDLPDSKIQSGIAKVYRSLDDKIALNRKLNATLEAMAQALFQSWFVDFDPVKAKLAAVRCGRDPEQAAMAAIACKLVVPPGKPKAETLDALLPSAEAMDAAIAALAELSEAQHQSLKEKAAHFPADFQESELGLIPLGWAVDSLGDHVQIIKGKSYKSSELEESKTALVTLKSFLRGGGYREDGLKGYSGAYKDNQVVEPGELIIAYTDVTQAAELVGRPALVMRNDKYDRLVISLDVAVVRSPVENEKYFYHALAKTSAFTSHALSYTSGTTVLHLSKNALPSFRFCSPTNVLVQYYSSFVENQFRTLDLNCRQSRTLANLRDTLLPKLLSGEISVGPN